MLQPYLVDLDQADVSMQEAEATQPAANPQRPATLIFNRPAAFSNSIPVYLAPKAHLLDLQERLRSIYFPSRIVSSLFIPPLFWRRVVCCVLLCFSLCIQRSDVLWIRRTVISVRSC